MKTQLLRVTKALNSAKIFPRRYFYPSLNTLPYVNKVSCPVSETVSKTVLCLPLYHDLKEEEIHRITNIILENL